MSVRPGPKANFGPGQISDQVHVIVTPTVDEWADRFEHSLVHAPVTYTPTATIIVITAAVMMPIRIEYSTIAAPLSSSRNCRAIVMSFFMPISPFGGLNPTRQSQGMNPIPKHPPSSSILGPAKNPVKQINSPLTLQYSNRSFFNFHNSLIRFDFQAILTIHSQIGHIEGRKRAH
ncbi:hypothetical protein MPL3356_310013 [Mesorhizobium plurifarium]|uniref:Uncharacterized protein n=1 Tax=Mesorhizobium plurifarium TaxID=69974 RepID=A0A090E061_MESPL|nr:hypothetical protein MPL3356_310013 [Mesorhizobium plurifarium]